MGIIYVCASSILLCPEDSSSVLGFDEREKQEQDAEGEVERRGLRHFAGKRSDFYGGFLMDSTLLSEDCIASLVERELQHLPRGDYAERLLRGQLDLAVGEAKYVFEARTIQRMELLVLSTLKWRMQAVTPFSFIVYFLCKFHDANSPDGSLISASIALVLATVRGVDLLEFRPSEIAAAVALSALKEIQFLEIDEALACCIHVNKERVLRCHEVIREMALMKNRAYASTSVSTVPKSPIGVLDAACLSSKSDDTAVGSHANCDHSSSPSAKRRKLNRASTS
ncbi:hypothetical protein GW17_00014648 [Ensete ventricosum]|nr:hypothetical protein GW17_00014648 [Ensete ventricosum]